MRRPPESIVILTGAGISAESGLATFRGADGLWENHRIEDVASIEGFLKNPSLVQRFYNERRQSLGHVGIKPNPAHLALKRLEEQFRGEFLLVTQNVDNLHERAGSRKLLHMHGELTKVRCTKSEQIFEWKDPLLLDTCCPCCQEMNRLRPHIVWFGEMPLFLEEIYARLEQCDLFVAIGTSGNVYPAAGFVQCVSDDTSTLEINLEESLASSRFQEKRHGLASTLVPLWVDELLNSAK